MSASVRIPTPLRSLTKGAAVVAADGATVGEILEDLERRYGGLRERLRDEQGNVRRFVSLFVNSEDVRHLQALGTPVAEGDEIAIVPAIAGG